MAIKLLPTLQKSAGITDDFMSSVDELKSSIQEKIDDIKPLTDTKDDSKSSIADFKAFIQNNINAIKPPTDTKDDLQASIDEVKAYIRKNVDDFKQYSKMNPELTNSLIGGTMGLGIGGLGALFAKDWRLPLLTALGGAGVGYASTQGGSKETGKSTTTEKPKETDKSTITESPKVPITQANKNLISGIGTAITGGAAVGGAKTYHDYTNLNKLRDKVYSPDAAHWSEWVKQDMKNKVVSRRSKSRRNALLTALAGAVGLTTAVTPQVMDD